MQETYVSPTYWGWLKLGLVYVTSLGDDVNYQDRNSSSSRQRVSLVDGLWHGSCKTYTSYEGKYRTYLHQGIDPKWPSLGWQHFETFFLLKNCYMVIIPRSLIVSIGWSNDLHIGDKPSHEPMLIKIYHTRRRHHTSMSKQNCQASRYRDADDCAQEPGFEINIHIS